MLFLVEKSYAADADAAILVGCAVTKMVKNDCGEGRQIAMRIGENIYKRKDGRWEARTAIGRKKNGRLSYRSFYGRTYREVKTPILLYWIYPGKILLFVCFAPYGLPKEDSAGSTAHVSVIKAV